MLPQNKSTISRRAEAFANSSRDQQEGGLALGEFTHYKRRFTLYICSTFKKGISRPKAQKIRERLGASLCTDEPIWDKPKGMHWKTFERLKNKAEEASEQSWQAAARLFGTLDPFA